MSKKTQFDSDKLLNASQILRALTHKLRMHILSFIDEKGKVNVYDIYTSLNLDQSITSQNLRILRNHNLVNTSRKGKEIYYSTNKKLLNVSWSCYKTV